MRILVVENDPALGKFLQQGFGADRYAVDVANEEAQAQRMLQEREYDAAILDLNVPQQGGFDVLREVRARRPGLPILILTSRNRLEDRVRVLDLGADDFVLKPFAFSELSARVRALLRRGAHAPEAVLRIEDLELDRMEHKVKRAGRAIELTPKEFSLLEYLMRNAGERVTRAQIIQHVWNLSFDTMTNVVDVYINYLRKKVDAQSGMKLIHTIRGVGYRLHAMPDAIRGGGAGQNAPAPNGSEAECEAAVAAGQKSKS
jgi:DNA-binding response OmpR family regulator